MGMEYFNGWTVVISLVTIFGVYYVLGRRRVVPCAGGVVVTGASSGIGESTAVYLDGLGFTVFAGVRQQLDYQRLTSTLSTRSKAIILDVTSKTSIAEAVNIVSNHLEKASIGLVGLVNNAGLVVIGPIECVPEDEVRYNFEVNLFGLMNTTNAFSPLLRAGGKLPSHPSSPQDIATIIHIGSTMGRAVIPFYGSYAMTKHALEALASAQRFELSQSSSIRVSLMDLGTIKTPIFEKNNERLRKNLKGFMQVYQKYSNGLIRMGELSALAGTSPLHVAKAVEDALRSASPKSRYLIGWEPWIVPLLIFLLPAKIMDFALAIIFNLVTKIYK